MSNYKIVGGRVFRGVEIAVAEQWLNDAAAAGWDLVSVLPVVEDGHAMYVFQHSGSTQFVQAELPGVPEPSHES